jgi:hypothetical protein
LFRAPEFGAVQLLLAMPATNIFDALKAWRFSLRVAALVKRGLQPCADFIYTFKV